MFDNHVYNLMAQITEEHRSLWRMKNMYEKDSDDCSACGALWVKLEKDKEEHIRELTALLQQHTQ